MNKFFDEILQISGNVVTVRAPGVAYNELAMVVSDRGSSLAQVIQLQDDLAMLQVFEGSRGISTRDRVRFFGRPM